MTEMIDNFTFAPKRTFTVADAVRAAPGAAGAYFSMHFGKCEGRFAVVLHARSHTPSHRRTRPSSSPPWQITHESHRAALVLEFYVVLFAAAPGTVYTQSRERRARVFTGDGVRRLHSDAYAGARRGRVDGETVRVEISSTYTGTCVCHYVGILRGISKGPFRNAP